MDNIISRMKTAIWRRRTPRLRDRRGHYPSSALMCMRDLYWRAIGEPSSNETDYIGSVRMMLGNAVEDMLRERVFKNMHFLGEFFISDQVKVGGTAPDWDGYMDALMATQNPPSTPGDGPTYDKYVVEVKAVFGFGADLLLPSRNNDWGPGAPKESHAVQLGLYLKDASEKDLCKDGWLIYFCMSDRSLGSIVGFRCKYEAPYIVIDRYRAVNTQDGGALVDFPLDLQYNVDEMSIERWKKLDQHIADRTEPEPDYQYKYDITPELLRSRDTSGRYRFSDTQLKKAVDGKVILGDWQVKYSDYKEKQLAKLDEKDKLHSDDERGMMKAEYIRRHPSQKLY